MISAIDLQEELENVSSRPTLACQDEILQTLLPLTWDHTRGCTGLYMMLEVLSCMVKTTYRIENSAENKLSFKSL